MNRESILDKIRALLGKTVENGCTEHEAMAALDKARAMMDAYEVSDVDLKLAEADAAILRNTEAGDAHNIRANLATSIAAFCDCKVWRCRGGGGLTFCGLPSDVDFASWLLDTLAAFVQAELAGHLIGCLYVRSERRRIINGFVAGCTRRIRERVDALVAASRRVAESNSRALVVVKNSLIDAAMTAAGIKLGRGRRSSRVINRDAYAAGQAAGDRASFGRPIEGAGAVPRLGRP